MGKGLEAHGEYKITSGKLLIGVVDFEVVGDVYKSVTSSGAHDVTITKASFCFNQQSDVWGFMTLIEAHREQIEDTMADALVDSYSFTDKE